MVSMCSFKPGSGVVLLWSAALMVAAMSRHSARLPESVLASKWQTTAGYT
jgi:hypothetical protein